MATQIVATTFGGPEVLSPVEVEVPQPGPGQVVIAVKAAGVNRADHKIVSGMMGADPERLPLPVGLEVAGVVTAVGPDATGPGGPIAVGDEVVAHPVSGGYAESVTAPAKVVVPKPPALDWTVAGSVLLVGGTAAHALQVAGAKPGETLLVHGAAGSVGQIAVQIAVQDGVRVVGTAGESNHELLRSYGVIPVTYGPGLADRVRAVAPEGVDAAIDTIGTDEAVDVSLELVADHSRIVSIAAFGRADSGIKLISGDDPETKVRANSWQRLLPAAADGSLKIVVARTYPLAEAAGALQFVRDGHAGGKVVLLP
ncbi:quinone oxidoreductase family protein [Pseudonocardia charpentierae]|uniref:NADP-dependent oxidoreductase n=1 Tax=Pseudonocardia charpentierae TaxID=3075545 RepID=A0ABU2NCQ4_9PSEU|nr:NADP-dependent oxidoreductase [Pseudonocardia sp. DSM 45834]MDT0351726.1 NADP-dependent oxidoreductase [Pseudonocardia sp. DSM 45834]